MHYARAIILLLLAALVAPGCDSIPSNAIIVVGDFGNPPFSSRDEDRSAVGLEVELLAMVGEQLGRPVVWRERPFAELLPATVSGEAHVAASTIGITEERARQVAFSRPYHETRIAIVVRVGDGEPSRPGQLTGERVAAGKGTTSESALLQMLPGVTRVVDAEEEGVTLSQMLLQGSIEALVLDGPAGRRLVAENPRALRMLDETLGKELYGFAVNPGEAEILEAINSVIERLESEHWFENWFDDEDARTE